MGEPPPRRSASKYQGAELRRSRRRRQHRCSEHLIVAPLWVAYEANLGTLLRTCDAAGACIAVPPTAHYRQALERGDTLGGNRPHIHWASPNKDSWIHSMRAAGWHILAVELAEVPKEGSPQWRARRAPLR